MSHLPAAQSVTTSYESINQPGRHRDQATDCTTDRPALATPATSLPSTIITTMQSRTSAHSRCSRSRSGRRAPQTLSSSTPRDQELNQLLVQAKERELRLRHYAAEADRDLPKVIKRLRGLSSINLLSRDLILGPVVMLRSDGFGLADEGDTVVQAALGTTLGPVALFWSGDEFSNPDQFTCLEEEALSRAVPLSQCSIAVRGLVWPELPKLFKRALNRVSYLRFAD